MKISEVIDTTRLLMIKQKPVSAKEAAQVVQQQFDYPATPEEVEPLIRHLNQALQDINPHFSSSERKAATQDIWRRFAGEVSHGNRRSR